MTDYIKREDALRMVKGVRYKSGLSVEKAFEIIPSADVAPVRHGYWIEEPYQEDVVTCRCSECLKIGVMTIDGNKPRFKYCPMCGAKMDGESND